MIIYSVYIDDPECPKQLFQTYEKEKAEKFIDLYNKGNSISTFDLDKAFLTKTELDPNIVEAKANSVISDYRVFYRILVRLHSDDTIKIVQTKKCYDVVDKDEFKGIPEFFDDEIYDFKEVIFATYNLREFLNLPEDKIVERVKAVIKEWEEL